MAKTEQRTISFLTGKARFALAAMSLMLAFASTPPAVAQQDLNIGRSTGLPLPRFDSVDHQRPEANIRFGPARQYPINWVFTRPGVPLKIIAEFDNWRKIEDHEGEQGWISAQLLSGQRTIMVQGGVRDLKRTADSVGRVILRAEVGVIGSLLECQEIWCRVEIEGQRGWLQRGDFWGTLAGELLP